MKYDQKIDWHNILKRTVYRLRYPHSPHVGDIPDIHKVVQSTVEHLNTGTMSVLMERQTFRQFHRKNISSESQFFV